MKGRRRNVECKIANVKCKRGKRKILGPCFRRDDRGGGNIETITLTLNIPGWLAKPAVFFLLLYRRVRYGYAFRRIPLTQGKFAIVDPEDYGRLNKYKWYASGNREKLYAARAEGRKKVFMHREIIPIPHGMVADHINRDRLDNRKTNLRPATTAQNAYNRPRNGARFMGLSWDNRRGKWRVRVSRNGKRISVGCFGEKTEAARAYDEAVKKYHGEFAVLNFPD